MKVQLSEEQITKIQSLRDKANVWYRNTESDWLRSRCYGEYEAYCRVLAILGIEPLPEGMSEN